LTFLIPGNFLFQLTQGKKSEVVANCDHLQNLTAPQKLGRRPIAPNMRYVARFSDALPVAAIVSTLSRHLHWNHVVILQLMHKDGITVAEYWTELPTKAELAVKKDAARVFYVAATRAMHTLLLTTCGTNGFGRKLRL